MQESSLAVVVGANRGIGLALVQALRQRGQAVLAVCRGDGAAAAEAGAELLEGIDVTVEADLKRLQATLAGRQVGLLLVNAGVLGRERFDALDAAAVESIRQQFETNALAPLRVVHAVRAALGAGSRIGILTSRMGSISDNGSGGYYGYRASKAAVNAIGRSLAIDLAPAGIALRLLHPGYVRTAMTGQQGDVTPAQAAAGLLARMDELDLASTGQFHHAQGGELPW